MLQRISIFTFCALLCASLGFAQPSTGAMYGIVSDPAGGVVPGVSVIARNLVTGDEVKTVTDERGWYRFAQLSPGNWEVSFAAPGFQTSIVRLTFKFLAQIRHDVTLEIGQVTESVVTTIPPPPPPAPSRVRYSRVSPDFNTEEYGTIRERGFLPVTREPLSTFSIDVDTASYSNVRRFLRDGALPPKNAVRVEELINYFRYDYPEPPPDQPFSIVTELAQCPWKTDHALLHIGLKGRSVDLADMPPGNLVFLIDVSGSMQHPNKLQLLKRAFALLTDQLRPQDQVAIVTYAGGARLALDSTPGTRKDEIRLALASLEAGGSTAGGEGIRLAYHLAAKNFIENGNNRVILATDGDFNVGVSSEGELIRLIEKSRERGVFLSVLGFGAGNIKDNKMEQLADHGNGNYAYIDSILEARRVLVKEIGGTLLTIAKDVKLQLEFNPAKIASYRLIGYENRLLNTEEFADDKKDAGDLGAGHTVTALYELIPAAARPAGSAESELKYQEARTRPAAEKSAEAATVKLRFKEPDGDTSRLLTQTVNWTALPTTEASPNFQFSAAVAAFGMLLRDSEFRGDSTYAQAAALAESARTFDPDGLRSEFLFLLKTAQRLAVPLPAN